MQKTEKNQIKIFLTSFLIFKEKNRKNLFVPTNARVRLHFLIRRYKEDRNDVIHSKFEGFNHKWKNYIYLSAIEQIYDVIKEYENMYGA